MDIDEDEVSADGSSSGAFTETAQSDDSAGRSDGAFSETQGEIDYDVEMNADNNLPMTAIHGEEMHVNDGSGSNLVEGSSTAHTFTNIAATQIVEDEDVPMDSSNLIAPISEILVVEDTAAHSLPRTTRFAELQERADELTIQSLMNTLENQVHGGGINHDNNTREISILATPDTLGESAVPQVSRSVDTRHARNSHSLILRRGPPDEASAPHLSRHSSAQSPSSQAVHSGSPQITAASDQNRTALGNRSVPVSGNMSFSGSPDNSPGARDENSRNEASSISQTDFMRLIRSVESLSANVRILINRPTRPMPHINSAEASTRHPLSNFVTSTSSPSIDELEEARPRTLHRRKPVGENQIHNIMRTVLDNNHLRISRRKRQYTLKESISKIEVDEFVAGSHSGPTLSDLRLDWTEPMTSLWNSTAIYLLANHVLERVRSHYYPGLELESWMTIDRFFDELKAKLTVSREEYENAVASTAPETDVDAAEIRARYAAKKARKKIRNRRNMRRKTLFNCRLGIIQENLGSDPAWENALRLMYVIGDSAMSDDETDNERSTRRKKVVRRVEKQWASASLKSMVTTLDLYYSRFLHNGNQKPGPGPRDRLTTIVSESPRSTPTALPQNCYSGMYLNSLSPYQRSRLRYKREMIIPILPLPPL